MKIKVSREHLKKILTEVINEKLGSFNEQSDVAQEIISHLNEMFKNGIVSKTFKIKASSDIDYAEIQIVSGVTLQQIIGFDPDIKKISICVGTKNIENPEKLTSSIAHELMHGHIYMNMLSNNPQLHINDRWNDAPNYYEDLIRIIRTSNGVLYYFSYAVYSTYYQEANTMVSQVSAEILDMAEKYDTIIPDNIKKLYGQTNSVVAFKTNINTAKSILSMNDDEINKLICSQISIEEFATPQKVKKECIRIINISNRALKDCARNAMIAQEKFFKQGKLSKS